MYKFIDSDGQHLHTFENKPLIGVSSVLGVIGNSSPLIWWASGLACKELGWIKQLDSRKSSQEEIERNKIERKLKALEVKNQIKDMSPDDYLKLLDKAYRAHTTTLDKKAKEGTDLHAEAEKWVKSVMRGQEITPHEKIMPFVLWSRENVKRFLWSEAHCFSTTLWCGGISDCGVELNSGEYAIIDFKSSKDAYLEQAWQVAGYDLLIEENGLFSKDGKHSMRLDKPISKHIIIPFGKKIVAPSIFADVQSNKEAFKACLFIYKQFNKNNEN